MPKLAKALTALEVSRLQHPKTHLSNAVFAVGTVSGLGLQITPNNARSWLLRYRAGDKRRELGLGPYPEVTLKIAHDLAREAKAKLREGVDPIAERNAVRLAAQREAANAMTFAQALKAYENDKLQEHKSARYKSDWVSSIQRYAVPHLGKMQVKHITLQDILKVLQQTDPETGSTFWNDKTKTAVSVRSRIEIILAWATVHGHREGDNPARWGGNLSAILPKPSKIAKVKNYPAVPLEQLADWYADMTEHPKPAARAIQFIALTASRTNPVLMAKWDEIDFEHKVWTSPAAHMKMERDHKVPLSPAALALLESLPRHRGQPLIFPSARGKVMADGRTSAAMQAVNKAGDYADKDGSAPTVHGLRSSFRVWCSEVAKAEYEVSEAALAHLVGSSTERAYDRSDYLDRRRPFMVAWADFLEGNEQGKVVRLHG